MTISVMYHITWENALLKNKFDFEYMQHVDFDDHNNGNEIESLNAFWVNKNNYV